MALMSKPLNISIILDVFPHALTDFLSGRNHLESHVSLLFIVNKLVYLIVIHDDSVIFMIMQI